MSSECFRSFCNKSKFYFFDTPADFDMRVDYNGQNVKHIVFERGLVDEGIDNAPTRWSAYGLKK